MYDVVIIGGGIVGCAIASALKQYEGHFLLVEQSEKIGANVPAHLGAIVHAGFDVPIVSPKVRYTVVGNRILAELSRELSFYYRRSGALLTGDNQNDFLKLRELHQQGKKNRVRGLQLLWGAAMRQKEDSLPKNATAAMFSPDSGVTMPLSMMQAMIKSAETHGVEIRTGTAICGVTRNHDGFCLDSTRGPILTRTIICAAGQGADQIHNQLCQEKITLQNRQILYCHNANSVPRHRIVVSLHGSGSATPLPGSSLQLRITDSYPDDAIAIPYTELQDGSMLVGESCDGFFEASGIGQRGVTMSCAIGQALASAAAEKLQLKMHNNN